MIRCHTWCARSHCGSVVSAGEGEACSRVGSSDVPVISSAVFPNSRIPLALGPDARDSASLHGSVAFGNAKKGLWVRQKAVVGWNEYVEFPEWGVKRLGAKVDTGAKTSALHVEGIKLLPRGRIEFLVVVHRTKRDRRIHVKTKIARRGRVKSSNGHFESRYFVKTRMLLGPVDKEIELSLVDRGNMLHRMLLGREALQGDFVVDVGRRHVQDL